MLQAPAFVRFVTRRTGSLMELLETNFPFDAFEVAEPFELEHRARFQRLGSSELSIRDACGDCLFDFALRRHAEVLEELADVEIESLFIHMVIR